MVCQSETVSNRRVAANCSFRSDHLAVGEWHSVALPAGLELPDVVVRLLDSATTRWLPDQWAGEFDLARARSWIRERDEESTTLLVTEIGSREPVGLAILFDARVDEGDGIELRLGYVVAASASGRGYATELVAGILRWCRAGSLVSSVVAGVDRDHHASIRVLVKNGFERIGDTAHGEELYRVVLEHGSGSRDGSRRGEEGTWSSQ